MENLKKVNLRKALMLYFESKAPDIELLDVHKYIIDKAVDTVYMANLIDSDADENAIVDLLLLNLDNFYYEILVRLKAQIPEDEECTVTLNLEEFAFSIPSYEAFAILGDIDEAISDL